ncbi:MAG: hypothetical protein U9R79_09835, partial [Armatimonadota bacterium]|nr:hypothetical protein [Armatimonadota bacterium]
MILTGVSIATVLAAAGAEEPIDIGSRLELMVDELLIDRMTGAELRLHHPQPKETVIAFDEPWEGSACGYVTVFEDEGRYRMYYKAWHLDVSEGRLKTSPLHIGYAESDDGIVWRRPELGLFEFEGSTANNIVWHGQGDHGFSPFRDPNPEAPSEARYKAFGHGKTEAGRGVFAFASLDGIHWSLMQQKPVLTGCAFDSQNLAFWDSFRGEYRAYMRDFRDGIRDIKTATSPDFIHWSEPQWLQYPGAPDEALYTNQVRPYY